MTDEQVKRDSTSGSSSGEDDDGEESLRQRVEEGLAKLIPDLVKRTVEAGLGTLSRGERGRLRGLVGDLRVPRDVAKYFLAQVDDTKNALLRVFAGEVRDFLENTDMAEDLKSVLTSVSLEVSTRVRFVPNEPATASKPEEEEKPTGSDPKKTRRGKPKASK